VPVAYGHRTVLVRGYIGEVVIDPPPLKWPALRYGFGPEEDRDGEQEAPA
jgi:hypothetical protein